MAYVHVANGNGFGGFSFSKLTKWVGNTAAAIASKDTARITAQLTQAIPGAIPAAPKPITPANPAGMSPFAPGGFVAKNQTVLLIATAGLGAFLLFGRRMGRR